MTTSTNNFWVQHLAKRIDQIPGLPVDNPTSSFWQEPAHNYSNLQSKNLPTEADIVILGSGIAAVSTAVHLHRLKPRDGIVILEARTAISGATGRNGGHIKVVPYADYEALKLALGKESAIRIVKFRLAHLDALVREAEQLGEAGKAGLVRRVQGVNAVYDAERWQETKQHLEAWLEDFPEERSKWVAHEDKEKLKEIGVPTAEGAIIGPSGAAWPYRLIGCFLNNLIQSGQVTLETNTPATAITRTQSTTVPYEVQTERGSIQTKHVIHCTNAHAATLLPTLKGKLWPFRGQMTVQSVPDTFPRLGASHSWGAIWKYGFDYITQSPAADGALYLGGGALQGGLSEDQDVGSTDDSQQSQLCLNRLESVLSRGFGIESGTKIEKQWTGIMGFTGDDLPYVGKINHEVTGREDCDPATGAEWIAAGWNGYGMVHCWLSGKALASMVTGDTDGLRDWFPEDEFACTKARLDKMTPEGGVLRLLEI